MRFFQPVKIPFPLLGLVLPAAVLFAADTSTPAPKPEVPLRKPYFQNDFFGEMPRAFCIIQKIDLQARTMVVKVLKAPRGRWFTDRDNPTADEWDNFGRHVEAKKR